MPGSRLSMAEREEIRAGLERSDSIRQIGRDLGRAPSTVSREVTRNRSRRGYVAHVAHRRARVRARRPKPLRLATDTELRRRVRCGLDQRLSPQVIAWQLAAEGISISHETIYRACYHQSRPLGERYRGLPRPRKGHKRQRRTTTGRVPQSLGNYKSIHERPGDLRTEAGHWEGDLIVGAGNRSATVVLTERRSRLTMLGALPRGKNADEVAAVINMLLAPVPARLRRTLTWDQGRELARWQHIETVTGIEVFFADARSPWQKPLVENTNALLRRWLPKAQPMPSSQHKLNRIAHQLNTMPRRILHKNTAQATYHQLTVATTT